jgi:hypothetical protein
MAQTGHEDQVDVKGCLKPGRFGDGGAGGDPKLAQDVGHVAVDGVLAEDEGAGAMVAPARSTPLVCHRGSTVGLRVVYLPHSA